MRTTALLIASLVTGLTSAAQESVFDIPASSAANTEKRPWTDKPFLNDSKNFQFVVVTDRTGGHRDGIFEQAVSKINLLRPEFVMSVGDLVEGYYDNESQSQREWTEFDGMVDTLDMRFFYVPGNHDIWSDFSRKTWDNRFGTSYYHFVYQDVLFLAINSEDGRSTTLGSEQADYFINALTENPDVRWTLVFMHKPMWYYEEGGSNTGWARLEDALKDRPHTVFAGHRHRYIYYERNGMRYIDLATTGGGSRLNGPVHGRFDHFVWVTMTDEGPILANVLLDGIVDEKVSTEETSDLVNQLSASFRADVDPIFINDSDENSALRTMARITNSADQTLKISGRFGIRPGAFPRPMGLPGGFQVDVAPNSELEVPITVRGMNRANDGRDILLPLEIQAVYDTEIAGDILWEFPQWVVVDVEKNLSAAPDSVSIDGNLDEWKELPALLEEPMYIGGASALWDGPADASAAFGVAYDDNFVYVMGTVVDDHFVDKPGETAGSQDYLSISLSPVANDSTIVPEPWTYTATPSNPNSQNGARASGDNAPEATFVGVPTNDGYAFELAIPTDSFGDWDSVRIGLTLTDVDSHTGSRTSLAWRPNWQTGAASNQLGVFKK